MNAKITLVMILFLLVILLLFYYIDLESNIVILLGIVIVLLLNNIIKNKEYFKTVNELQQKQMNDTDNLLQILESVLEKDSGESDDLLDDYPSISVDSSCINRDIMPEDSNNLIKEESFQQNIVLPDGTNTSIAFLDNLVKNME